MMSKNTSGAAVWLLAIVSTQVVSTCNGFVQPLFSYPLLRTATASVSSNLHLKSTSTCNGNGRAKGSRLFSTAQEVDTNAKTGTKIQADGDDFIKSTLDTRSYRSILLPNNLQALLVSDPETDVEAGAVHIKAGHFDDPDTRAGLAHL
jgi:hypothetical protein